MAYSLSSRLAPNAKTSLRAFHNFGLSPNTSCSFSTYLFNVNPCCRCAQVAKLRDGHVLCVLVHHRGVTRAPWSPVQRWSMYTRSPVREKVSPLSAVTVTACSVGRTPAP